MDKLLKNKKNRAFTLVEILIVVIIIGILAGLMALSAGSSTETAEKTACRGDRRTIKSAYYVERAENGKTFKESLEKAMEQFTKGHELNADDTMAMYEGICHAGGVYIMTESDEGDGTLGVMCTIQGHGGEDLYGWARLRVYAAAINRILELTGSARQEMINKLLGKEVDIKGSVNTNISEALLAQTGSWPKWEKDGSLYVHPHFLNGQGEVLYFANGDNNKVTGWNAKAIYYNGKWYEKVVDGEVVGVGVSNVYKYATAAEALKKDTKIQLLKDDGSINTDAGWQEVK